MPFFAHTSTSQPDANPVVRFLGSVRLAVPLLGAIALILIAATFYESHVGSPTIQRLVYKSPWFGALMFLLAVNLGISTISRYPWKGSRRIGFAITHWGLVVLIAGSAAVIHLSTEGMLLVRMDSGPNNQIRVEGDALEVITPTQQHQQTDIFIRSDGSVYPPKFAGLSLLGYSKNTMDTVSFINGGTVDNLAVQIQLTSERMGQALDRWLAVAPASYGAMDMGPAHLEVKQATTEDELQQYLSPPDTSKGTAGLFRVGDRAFDIETQMGQSIPLEAGITATLTDLWPDFRLNGGNQPTSASDQFRNPAIQLVVTQQEDPQADRQADLEEKWFVFANPDFPPIRSGDDIILTEPLAYEAPAPDATNKDYVRIVSAPDHTLYYAALASTGFKTGPLDVGDTITPGWADIQILLVQALPQAQLQRQTVPMTPVAPGTMAADGEPALQVRDTSGHTTWLPWSRPTTIDTLNGALFAAFSPKQLKLPFYVKLNDFIVERNEGSESVAMWTSKVTLFDPVTDTAVERSVWMNHPTWFRGWKLAQASWNPGDLQQSTLQLKREPWWVTSLTWLGSIMVVTGISVMFYGRSLTKQFKSLTPKAIPQPSQDLVLCHDTNER